MKAEIKINLQIPHTFLLLEAGKRVVKSIKRVLQDLWNRFWLSVSFFFAHDVFQPRKKFITVLTVIIYNISSAASCTPEINEFQRVLLCTMVFRPEKQSFIENICRGNNNGEWSVHLFTSFLCTSSTISLERKRIKNRWCFICL